MADVKAMLKVKPKNPKIGEIASISLMAMHPMETGQTKNKETGELIPAHFISEIEFLFNSKAIAKIISWETISANPFYEVNMRVEEAGELKVIFKDNNGHSQTLTTALKVG